MANKVWTKDFFISFTGVAHTENNWNGTYHENTVQDSVFEFNKQLRKYGLKIDKINPSTKKG